MNNYGTPFQNPGYVQPYNNYIMPMIYGRMVNSEADIFPNQIPNDGSAAYFPSTDGTKIYMRAWQKDGQVMRVSYSLDNQIVQQNQTNQQPSQQQNNQAHSQNDQLASVLTQLSQNMDAVVERLDKLEKSLTE